MHNDNSTSNLSNGDDAVTGIVALQQSEYHSAKLILLHQPGDELQGALLHPQAALFEKYFSISEAKKEHINYTNTLENFGCKVLILRDLLVKGCLDSNGKTIEGEPLEALRTLALNVLQYDTSALPEEMKKEQEGYKRGNVWNLSPAELADIIIKQPTVKLSKTQYNTGITADITYHPLGNLLYTRDQMITTSKGVVICSMNSPQRRQECEVMKFALNRIGITPIHEISGEKAFLEGGDFFITEETAFIGCGMRTTIEAIQQLMELDLIGTKTVVVVKDKRFYQAQMHLDTYFNIIDSDLVTLGLERQTLDPENKNYLLADVYEQNNGKYELQQSNIPFVQLLQNINMECIIVNNDDLAHFANNFLTVAPRTIMAVANQSEDFVNKLEEKGVNVTWLPLENLILGYGAAHCMKQVLVREKRVL